MSSVGSKNQRGVSLIEVVLVLVVLGIIATFAVSLLGKSSTNLERQNIAKKFKTSLERARFDSVKRHASTCSDMSSVSITSATSFTVLTDENADGTLDAASETRTVDFSGYSDVQIVESSTPTYPIIIRFDERGRTSSGPCSSETEVHTPTVFCNMSCTYATANAENASVVFVSPTGTAAFLTGGSTIPTFDAPSVSNSTSSERNPLLAIWDLVTATPTPATPTPTPATPTPTPATPTPTPTPGTPTPTPTPGTPTPTPTPGTPTPTPSVTPTPTATPNYCASGVAPGTGGCICSPTQHLQGSKCRDNH